MKPKDHEWAETRRKFLAKLIQGVGPTGALSPQFARELCERNERQIAERLNKSNERN